MSTKEDIAKTFETLGEPKNLGLAFAITSKGIKELGGVDKAMKKLPRPDYEHRIWYDPLTNNLLVARPNAEGKYQLEDGSEWNPGKRLR